MAVGQRYGTYVYTLLGELAGKPLSRLLTTAVLIGIKSQIDGSGGIAELPELARIEMGSQRAGDVVKPGFPKYGAVEQPLDENYFRILSDLGPSIQTTLGTR